MRWGILLVALIAVASVAADHPNATEHNGTACPTYMTREPVPFSGVATFLEIAGILALILGIILALSTKYKFAFTLTASVGLVIALFAFAYMLTIPIIYRNAEGIGLLGGVHEHADFAVYIDGEKVSFSSNIEQLAYLHIHNDSDVLHKHARGVTLPHVFKMLNGSINSTCMVLDKEYCNTDEKLLKVYVSGRAKPNFEMYEIQDLDRILVSYGSESKEELQKQWLAVTDNACIPSNKCPERGTPPEEGCG